LRRYATRERFAGLDPALKGRAKLMRRYAALSSETHFTAR